MHKKRGEFKFTFKNLGNGGKVWAKNGMAIIKSFLTPVYNLQTVIIQTVQKNNNNNEK